MPLASDDLQDAQARLAAVVNSEIDAIIVIDECGIVESVNPAVTRIFGYSREEVVGRNVSLLMPEPYRREHDSYMARYLQTGERRIIGIGREVQGLRKNGTTFPVELSVSEMILGTRRMFTGIVRDLSRLKAAESALHRTQHELWTFLDNLPSLAAYIGPDDKYRMVNRYYAEVSGIPREKIVGMSVRDFLGEETFQRALPHLTLAHAGKHQSFENPITFRGETRWFVVNLIPDPAPAKYGLGIFLLATDITQSKALSSKLIEQASLVKLGELASIVAHEVKNPLAGLLGATTMLLRRLDSQSEEAKICVEMASRLSALQESVQDMLSYARPRTPRLMRIPIKILLDDVIALVAQDPQFSGVRVQMEGGDVEVLCDPEMIKPVILNIFVNAAQAMRGAGAISVRLESLAQVRCCRITVQDTGPGIPEAVRDRIFQPFFTTKGGGTGLGLPIAKRVIEHHGGEISVHCPPEGGTCVVLKLPLVSEARS